LQPDKPVSVAGSHRVTLTVRHTEAQMRKRARPRPPPAVDTSFFDDLDKSIGRYEQPAPSGLVNKKIRLGDDYVFKSGDAIAILPVDRKALGGVLNNSPPFVVEGVHTLYEWSMALADRHPYHHQLCKQGLYLGDDLGQHQHRMIASSDRVTAICDALLSAYFDAKLKSVHPWDEKPGDDLFSMVFRRADVLEVMDKLGADTEVTRLLREERENEEQAAALATREDVPDKDEMRQSFLAWMGAEKTAHGSYPRQQPNKTGRMARRQWASQHKVRPRETVEEWARELMTVRRGPTKLNRQTNSI
jgi:hypothetical protein